jgi:cell division septation protein DedD
MVQQVASRTQRRMDRKHAMILFVVLLVVALASFSLGVMVGRSGNRASTSASVAGQPVTLPKVAETAESQAPAAAVAPVEPGEKLPEEKLTFYDTLPRGQQPLGSGINLPPAKDDQVSATTQGEATAAASLTKPLPVVKPEAVAAKALAGNESAPKPSAKAPSAAKAVGGFVVQIASFQKSDQATALSNKLANKGYVTYIQQADLGSKGFWYRVYAGPYSERPLAEKAAQKLRSEEKFSPLVRTR